MNYDSSASAAFSTEFIVHIHSSKKSKRHRRAVAVIETEPVVDGSAFLVTAAWTGADHEGAEQRGSGGHCETACGAWWASERSLR